MTIDIKTERSSDVEGMYVSQDSLNLPACKMSLHEAQENMLSQSDANLNHDYLDHRKSNVNLERQNDINEYSANQKNCFNGRVGDSDKSDDSESEEEDSEESSDDSSEEEEEEEEDVEDKPTEEMKERWKELDKFASPVKVTNSQIDLPAYDPSGEFRSVMNQSEPYIVQNDNSVLTESHNNSTMPDTPEIHPTHSRLDYQRNLPTSDSEDAINQASLSGLDSVLSQYHRTHDCEPIDDTQSSFASPMAPVKRSYRRRQKFHEMYDGLANADVPNDLGQFVCPNCGRIYTNRSSLRSHIKKHYPDEQKRYSCEHCSYSSHYFKNLSKHIDLHHNDNSERRIYHCQVCDKPFLKEEQLLEHRKLHTADNTYICETCGKQFKTKLRLKYHMDVHNPDKPFVCDIGNCDRAFRTPKYLKNHKDEYHKLQPKVHYCPVESCSMYFQRKSHLKRHMSTHDGEKNYHCNWPDCKRSFRSQETLTVHYYRHTGAKPFNCELCNTSFRQKSALIYHYKHHHSKEASKNLTHNLYQISSNPDNTQNNDFTHLSKSMRGSRPASSTHIKSMEDVYSFGNEGSGVVPIDDPDDDMGSHIDGIINHLMDEPGRAPPGMVGKATTFQENSLLRLRIDAIVSEIFIRGSISLSQVMPLTPEELFIAEEALTEVLSDRASPVKRQAEMEQVFSPMNKSYSQHSSSRNASPMKCGTPRSVVYDAGPYEGGCVPREIHSHSSHHQIEEDEQTMQLALRAMDYQENGFSHSNRGLSTITSTVSQDVDCGVQDLSVLSSTRHTENLSHQLPLHSPANANSSKESAAKNCDTVLGNNGGDLLDQVLEDLKGIEQENLSASPDQVQDLTCPTYMHQQSQDPTTRPTINSQTLNLSKSNKHQAAPSLSNNPGIPLAHSGSADNQQQPKSLDSSLWSDSGYSSGHEQQNKDAANSSGLAPQLGSLDSGLAGSGSEASDPNCGSSGNPLLDAYNYSRQQAGRTPYLGMPSPYDAAVYARSAAVMGDHLRSLTALGSKYMDSAAGQYSAGSASLSERSLSGLGSGIPPGWPSPSVSSYGSSSGVAASSLQYPWAPPNLSSGGSASPTGFANSSGSTKIGNSSDYSGYADYLTARATLNQFSAAGNKEVEAYRSALNDYRGFSQTTADLYSQMAASAGGYDKYPGLYSGRESAFSSSNQRPFPSIGGSSESAFQNTSAYADRSSYMTGGNPFYPSSQYYLAASRQLSGAAASGLTDPYRSSMLHNMPPFSRYPF